MSEATDWKHTLNLPQTAFPMKADLAKREPELLRYWRELDLYQRQRIEFAGRPVHFANPQAAQAAGIVTIYQEFTLAPDMTIAENVFIGREPGATPAQHARFEAVFGRPASR